MPRFALAALLVLPILAAPARGEDPDLGPVGPTPDSPPSEMAPAVARWSLDRWDEQGPRPVESWEGSRRRAAAYADAWSARLREVDFDALGVEGKVDAILLENAARELADSAKFDRRRDAEVEAFVPFAAAVEGLAWARYRLEPVDPEKAAGIIEGIGKQAEEAKKAAEARQKGDDKVPPHLAARASRAIGANQRALEAWFRHYEAFDPMVAWWCREPFKKADEALKGLAKFFDDVVSAVKDGDRIKALPPPLGREEIESALRTEMIAYAPEQLLAIAEREFAWCDAERKKAAAEMGLGDDWKAALEKVKQARVAPGGQFAMIKGLVDRTTAFVDARDLVTIPALARQTWTMETTPAASQKDQPYYFYDGRAISMAYGAEAMGHDAKLTAMRSNNAHMTQNLGMHELIPGHHLQMFMNARHQPHRRAFSTPFWIEGWALYWEILMWDLGYAQTPQDRLGLLFWRTHRCARIVFSLKYHLGEMTAQQAVDYLIDRVGHEKSSAEGEVSRSLAGGYGPLYQAAYMLGGLQFRALSRELVDSGKLTSKQFHDRILTGGPMPVELVRARLSGAGLTRDFKPTWKFAGEVSK